MSKYKCVNYLLILSMLLYFAYPCFANLAEVVALKNQLFKTITFYTYKEQVVDESDDSGIISSYLGRDVRSVINLYPKKGERSLVNTDYMIKNGKDVLGETDESGTTLNSVRQYNPYGKEVDYTSSTNKETLSTNHDLTILSNPYGYSRYYRDSESDLCYLSARYYSPELMRFISRDSYDLLNRYSYADGNPIMNVDPNGHFSIPNWANYAMAGIGIFSGLSNPISFVLGIAALATQVAADKTTAQTSRILNIASMSIGGFDMLYNFIDYMGKISIQIGAQKTIQNKQLENPSKKIVNSSAQKKQRIVKIDIKKATDKEIEEYCEKVKQIVMKARNEKEILLKKTKMFLF